MLTPFINGGVLYDSFNLSDKKSEFFIISRRDRNRAGYRYTSRGGDLDGNVSNFADNE